MYAAGFGIATARGRALPPDFAALVATLGAAQAATRTAAAELFRRNQPNAASLPETLTLLLGGRGAWAQAASALDHAFNPAVARMLAATARQGS